MSIAPSLDDFLAHRGQERYALLVTTLLVDHETPVSLFAKLGAGRDHSFLLESAGGDQASGRYSYLGLRSSASLVLQDGVAHYVAGEDREAQPYGDPLAALRERLQAWSTWSPAQYGRLRGGAVGYLGFDAMASFEGVPLAPGPGLGMPEGVFLFPDELALFDHLMHRLHLMVRVPLADGDAERRSAYACGQARLRELTMALAEPLPALPAWSPSESSPQVTARSNRSPEDMMAAVRRAKEAIVAGDTFQIVISQRFSVEARVDPFLLYRALRALNPSPYMFFLRLGERTLVGASPEVLVRVEGGDLLVRPIAGTRPRGRNEAEDRALEAELLADEKELAEHRMLVDLGRNDLGRVAAVGSVRVERPMHIERFSHVMHIVTDVRAKLAAGHDSLDVLRAAFPAGTVSGAPKIRACELLAELEPDRRGVYAGAVGTFAIDGDMDTCIAIRTMVVEPDAVHVQAGAGIVFDSVPEREHAECQHKARACLEALRVALARQQELP